MNRRVVWILALAASLLARPAEAASLATQCRRACTDEVAACTAAGQPRRQCRQAILRQCKTEGISICTAPADSPRAPGATRGGALVAPGSLTAAAVSSSTIDLSWVDTNSKETGYAVERSLGASTGFAVIVTVGIDQQAYRDTGLTPATTYYYRVRALGRRGSTSPYSNVASATTLPAPDTTAPSVPTGLTAMPASCSQIDLSWNPSTDGGGSGLLGYRVYRDNTFLKQVLAPLTSTSDTGLAPSTAHGYTVSAIDNAGMESARSSAATAATPACPTTSTTTTSTTTTSSSTTMAPTTSSTTSTSTSSTTTNTTSSTTSTTTSTTSTTTTRPTTTTISTTSTTTTTTSTTTNTTTQPTTTTTLPNQPPVANAGPDQASQTLVTLTFDGSSSSDPDGTIASYAWTFGDGTTASGRTVTHSFSRAGSYTVGLTVTDNGGLSRSDTAFASISNRSPVANAGPDQSALVGNAVSFSGAGSSDPDGTIASYAWDFGDGSTGTGVSASHAYAAAGAYTARLTVTDDLGATGTDTALVTVTAPAGGGAYLWSKTLGSAGDDRGQAVTVDGSGNLLATGTFTGTIDFGTGPLTSAHFDWLNATDYKDVFLAKYTPAGTAVWVRQIGAESNDGGQAVATDANGDVVVTGYVSNGVDFGNGVLTTSYGNYDIFVAKYAGTNGQYRWAKRFGTSFSEYGYGVAVDGSGNVIVTGVFYGTVDFGGGPLTTVSGSADIFVAKFRGTDGQHLWSKAIGGTGTDYGYGVAVDGSGNVAVVGRMSGSVDFGGGALTSAGGFDAFVAKYAGTDGHYLWARRAGGTGNDYLDAVAVNGAGDVLVAGNFPGTATFGGGTLTSAGGTDGVVVKYAGSTGAFVWQRQFGGTGDDAANGVTVDGSGNVGITGSFTGTVDFGNGPLVAAGGMDGVAVKYTGAGIATWSKAFGGTATDYGRGVAADAGGPLNVIGAFYGTANFGGGYRSNAGLFDIFLLRLGS